MTDSQPLHHSSPDRPSTELPAPQGGRLIVPPVVIPVVTQEHMTPGVVALHRAQGIVANVLVSTPLYQRLNDATFSAICSAACQAQFGEAGTQEAPSLTGPSQSSWQLVQVAEHLLRRQVEPAVIEAAMKEVLRPA
jgi:hypothetical protein